MDTHQMMYSAMNRIYRRYVDALESISDRSITIDAAKLTLKLAMQDLADVAISAERDDADQRYAQLEIEICRANTDLNLLLAERDGMRSQLAQMDAENSRLIQELAVVRSWSVAPHTNGRGIDNDAFGTVITNAPVAQPQPAQPAQSADSLPAVPLTWPEPLNDWVEGLEKRRHDWRKLPRDVRWRLIANVVQQVKTSGDFDAHRPQWMTSARAAALTFGDGLWENVVERARWLNE